MDESILIDQEGNDLYMRCIPRGFESQVVLSKDAMTAPILKPRDHFLDSYFPKAGDIAMYCDVINVII